MTENEPLVDYRFRIGRFSSRFSFKGVPMASVFKGVRKTVYENGNEINTDVSIKLSQVDEKPSQLARIVRVCSQCEFKGTGDCVLHNPRGTLFEIIVDRRGCQILNSGEPYYLICRGDLPIRMTDISVQPVKTY